MTAKSVRVRWRAGLGFVGRSDEGEGEVTMAGDAGMSGYRPTDLLLTALAGCAGMDVMAICRKKRQSVLGYEVAVTGEQRPGPHPRTFQTIVVEHHFQGGTVDPAAVRRAIELSATRYCPVSAHLSQGETVIHHRYRLSGVGRDRAEEVTVTGPHGLGLAPLAPEAEAAVGDPPLRP